MRIISGKYKSRKIYSSPAAAGTKKNLYRPTSDRAKETLFNVLNNLIDFDQTVCLDLFAGSGSLGFESLSRGAERCHFVEPSVHQIKMIKKTVDSLGCSDKIKIFNEDAIAFLESNSGERYDLIFADPPYTYENYNELLTAVLNLKFSIFVVEFGTECKFLYEIKEFDIVDKKIGVTNFKVFVSKD
ncbi:MAG: 16S rRNA (guanine(966)-N(2))-methyltransferase RsmD [Chlorobi bacterium]|nr:16S rRNA (guanine(966)-N(2))-methyltransferase RsmD [Chlorobiota bacterium]MCI0717336.1 16S rRNA (guanine(966)-N(2))-methyltransferase RsmD [Chlorobiota bacterium]